MVDKNGNVLWQLNKSEVKEGGLTDAIAPVAKVVNNEHNKNEVIKSDLENMLDKIVKETISTLP